MMAKWAMVFALAGFVGAGIFYSPYLGIDGQDAAGLPSLPARDNGWSLATGAIHPTYGQWWHFECRIFHVGWTYCGGRCEKVVEES